MQLKGGQVIWLPLSRQQCCALLMKLACWAGLAPLSPCCLQVWNKGDKLMRLISLAKPKPKGKPMESADDSEPELEPVYVSRSREGAGTTPLRKLGSAL